MAPLEPWEKVLISEEFTETFHGQIGCTNCHAGEQSEDMETAHTGLIATPSDNAEETCGRCHAEVTEVAVNSLHATLNGYWTVLNERSVPENHPELEEMFGNHCASCHASCGDCHISQPTSVGGGLIEGHLINAKPSMTRNCTACHGSRVGNEYTGKNEGLNPDIHFRQGRMLCTDCHTGAEMHGDFENAEEVTHRYDSALPRCIDCHAAAFDGEDDLLQHTLHGQDTLSCQVCHSVSYSSCDSCHVAVSETTGNPFFETAGTYLTFLIGKNVLQSEARPYEYVTVRHVPIDPQSFEYYGADLLPQFNQRPTWAYATPHNIQRITPQAEACANCHTNPEIFLTEDKVNPEELEANLPVIVDEVPELNP